MATALTVQTVKGPHPGTVAADALDISWAAGDVTGNTFKVTGEEILLMRNDDVGAQTITITSQPDAFGRKGDITDYSLAAGEYAAFWFGDPEGWIDGNGEVTVTPSDAAVFFAVLRVKK